MRLGEDHGIWGGCDQEERRALRSTLLTGDVFAYKAALSAALEQSRLAAEGIRPERPWVDEHACPRCGARVRAGLKPPKEASLGRTCGLPATYNAGCRCDPCAEAKQTELARQKALKRGGVPARGQVGSSMQPPNLGGQTVTDTNAEALDQSEVDARIAELEEQLAAMENELDAQDRLSLELFPAELFQNRTLDTSGLDPEDPRGFAQLIHVLQRIEDGVQFWLGDAMLWGESVFSDEVWSFITDRYKFKTLLNVRRICSILTPSERKDDVGWSVHRVIAESFPDSKRERGKALTRAVKGEWTYSEASAYCKTRRAELNPDAEEVAEEEDPFAEDETAAEGDGTVAPVDAQTRSVWAVRLDVDPAESAAAQELASMLSVYAEEQSANLGMATLKINIVHTGAKG